MPGVVGHRCPQIISTIVESMLDFHALSRHFDHHRNKGSPMNAEDAITALGALAQEHRLALFRLLVQAGERGMAAGAIAAALNVPNSSLSFHLNQLHRAGLVQQERQHRSLIYRANYPAMNALVSYLMENCCGGADCGVAQPCVEEPAQ
jgi:ArsR family transcriptional regulator, arsenate/arsenite/antimonite-responsive transcriptional repressor